MPRWPRRPVWSRCLHCRVARRCGTRGRHRVRPRTASCGSRRGGVGHGEGRGHDVGSDHGPLRALRPRVAGAGRVGVGDRRPERHLHRSGVDAVHARLFAGSAGRSARRWRLARRRGRCTRSSPATRCGTSWRVTTGSCRRTWCGRSPPTTPRGSVRHPDRHRDHLAATRRRWRPAPAPHRHIRADPAGGGPDPAGGHLAGG